MGKPIFGGSAAVGKHAEVFDAEALALRNGLRAAYDHSLNYYATNLWVCLDNQAVIRRVLDPAALSFSSQHVIREATELLRNWELRNSHSRGVANIRWVPGHAGISGNAHADRLANWAATHLEPTDPMISVAGGRRWAREQLSAGFNSWWLTTRHRGTIPLPSPTTDPPPDVPRGALARVLAARSGHGDFASYHERFNHAGAQLHCQCGARKTPLHFFYCRKAPGRHRLRLFRGKVMTIEDLITTQTGVKCMSEWMREYRYYSR